MPIPGQALMPTPTGILPTGPTASWPLAAKVATSVPPHGNIDQAKASLLHLVPPDIVQRAAEWSEFKTPEGKSYFFSQLTKQSVWEKPKAMVDLDGK